MKHMITTIKSKYEKDDNQLKNKVSIHIDINTDYTRFLWCVEKIDYWCANFCTKDYNIKRVEYSLYNTPKEIEVSFESDEDKSHFIFSQCDSICGKFYN